MMGYSNGSTETSVLEPYQVADDIWMVPCSLDRSYCEFIPLCKPLESEVNNEKSLNRHSWLPEEDEILARLTLSRGPKAWASIARDLNMTVHRGASVRQGKQCRERWYNHLNPDLKKGQWSQEEELFIIQKQLEIGNKWSEISRGLPGRTENQVKNKWKSMYKKAQKECPSGYDVVQFLIASRSNMEIEMHDTDKITLISPVMSQADGKVPFLYSAKEENFSSLAEAYKSGSGSWASRHMSGEQCVSPSMYLYFEHNPY